MGKVAGLLLAGIFATFLFELGANYLVWTETRRVHFLDGSARAHADQNAQSIKTKLHPYFGFINVHDRALAARGGVDINNYEFANASVHAKRFPFCCRYPIDVSDHSNLFIIAIFGNSIAHGLGSYFQVKAELEPVLRALPAAAGKDVLVLNMALGGYHQPQHLFVLSYLAITGMKVDAVIYYATAQELVAGAGNMRSPNPVAIEYPTLWLSLTSSLDAGADDDSAGLARLVALRAAQQIERRIDWCMLASCVVLHRPLVKLARWVEERAVAWKSSRKKDSHFVTYASARPSSDPMGDTAISWKSATFLMRRIAREMAAQFHVIVLPSPWVHPSGRAPTHVYHPLAETDGHARDARESLPRLVRAAEELNALGVSVSVATTVLDSLQPDNMGTYIDEFGHLGQQGMALLADFTLTVLREHRVPRSNLTPGQF